MHAGTGRAIREAFQPALAFGCENSTASLLHAAAKCELLLPLVGMLDSSRIKSSRVFE
jgi:hypothetical protein